MKRGTAQWPCKVANPDPLIWSPYLMLFPTQHFIIHSLLVTYFTQGGEGKEGERTCRSTCLTIKSLMNLSCRSLSMPEGIGDTWVLTLTKLVWSRCQKTAPVLFHFAKKITWPMAICLDLTLGQWWAIFQPLYSFRRVCFNRQRSWNSVHQIMCPWATDKWIYWTS